MEPFSMAALSRVETLLGRYPRPRTEPCGCDACAEMSARIVRGMRKAPGEASPDEVEAAMFSAYCTWCADWPELAHFVPAALRFLERGSAFDCWLNADPEMTFAKLLVSARPEMDPDFAPETAMPAQDRRAIFDAAAALLLHAAAAPDPDRLREQLAAMLGFLAQFDGPILPLLDAWRNDPRPLARARLCSVLAASALHVGREPFLGNTYLKGRYVPLPDNEPALADLFRPAHVAAYLLDHVDDCEALDEEERGLVDLGWQAAMQAAE